MREKRPSEGKTPRGALKLSEPPVGDLSVLDTRTQIFRANAYDLGFASPLEY